MAGGTADSQGPHLFVGRIGDQEWLVRVIGQTSNPDQLARIEVMSSARLDKRTPLSSVAEVTRAREKPTQMLTKDGQPAVLLAVSKRTQVNTLDLVERLNAYIVEKNRTLAGSGLQLSLLDDQTIPTRQAISIMQTNALYGLFLVLLITWIFSSACGECPPAEAGPKLQLSQ